MLERLNPLLRAVCVLLAALVLFQFARLLLPRTRALAEFSPGNLNFTADPPDPTNAPASTPPEVQARIDKIKDSQILGMIMRPPPMAVLGIAGRDVILRGPNGQTGLIREGEEVGGVKLLKIGTNRVLVSENGQERELMLFQGFGGESLMPKKDQPEK